MNASRNGAPFRQAARLAGLCLGMMIQSGQPAAAQPPAAASATPFRGARAILREFAIHWADADAARISDLFSADADLVIPTGTVVSGRAAIREFYAGVFQSGYAGSTCGASISRVRLLAPKLAIVDATWYIAGAKQANGDVAPTERGILSAIISGEGDSWKLVALREQTSATAFTPTVPAFQLP